MLHWNKYINSLFRLEIENTNVGKEKKKSVRLKLKCIQNRMPSRELCTFKIEVDIRYFADFYFLFGLVCLGLAA